MEWQEALDSTTKINKDATLAIRINIVLPVRVIITMITPESCIIPSQLLDLKEHLFYIDFTV